MEELQDDVSGIQRTTRLASTVSQKRLSEIESVYTRVSLLANKLKEFAGSEEVRHHNVESLHFTTSDGQDLHHAIAVVQTSNREYYILKDNGMQIGCEEDGIPLAWRRLLACTSTGIPR